MNSVKVNQQRGSWIGIVETGFGKIGMSPDNKDIAVVVIDDDVNINWKTKIYECKRRDADKVAWWDKETSARWRSLISSGKPILLRKGMNHETRSAGPKIGLFRIGGLSMDADVLTFSILERVAECT